MFGKVLDILFPPSNYERIVDATHALIGEPALVRTALGIPILSCAPYSDEAVHAAIRVVKKTGAPKSARLLGELLGDILIAERSEKEFWDHTNCCIVPIPQTGKRTRERGFNHLTLITDTLPPELHALVNTRALIQTRYAPMQKTLTREERFKNVAGIFAVPHPEKIRGMHIFLIDDVTTTGATLESATQALERAGATVTAIAIARA